jgi:hypothetical protein
MSVIALFTWILTAAFGLFLLAVWLIEYDRDYQRSAATRLPIPVISAHVLLAVTGLVVWVGYLLADSRRLAWAAAIILVVVATLGLIMAFRWFGVYRKFTAARTGAAPSAGPAIPPERNFPLPVVIAHGIFAVATVTLVVLTAVGVSVD